MKKNIIIYSLAAFIGLSGCSLDEMPLGSSVTEEQKEDVVKADPQKFASEVNALSANMIKFNTLNLDEEDHYDFGYAAVCIFYDSSGIDYVSDNTGYNWFRSSMLYSDRLATSSTTEFIWRVFYNNVKQANDILEVVNPILETIDSESEKQTFEFYKAQALGYRAFSYLNLIQTYQFTYKGKEDAPGVPLTLTVDDERGTTKRAPVKDVYAVILSDLTEAIDLLGDKTRDSKDQVSLQVAYGLRARVNLVMQNWKEAAEDAQKAQEGFTPYSLNAVSVPAFNNAVNNNSWIWANIISIENEIVETGIINWPSHVCSFTGNGYVNVGTYKYVNKPLWLEIPETDVRKHWWVDENLKAPYVDDITLPDKDGVQQPLVEVLKFKPYTNIKFGAYEDKILNATNASDWPVMRVEEMILIEAEAKAMSGDLAGGKTVLKNFLSTYRDPEYKLSTAGSAEAFQEEVWKQRRIELWGEGFSLFDILRLKKPLTRVEFDAQNKPITTYSNTTNFNLEAEHPILLYLLPEGEIEANQEIDYADNNPTIPVPKPLGELEKIK